MAFSPDWQWDSRGQIFEGRLHLWIVGEGRGCLKVNGTPYELHRGSAFVLRTRDHHQGAQDSGYPLRVHVASFDLLSPDGIPLTPSEKALPLYRDASDDFDHLEFLLQRMTTAFYEAAVTETRETTEGECWLEAVLYELRRQDRRLEAVTANRLQREPVETLCRDIRRAPGRPWTLAQMAETLGCSRNHLIRIFRAASGTTPVDFVVRARLDAAKGMLLYSNLPIKAIATELGYYDVFAFSNQFRGKLGISPSAYRQQSRS